MGLSTSCVERPEDGKDTPRSREPRMARTAAACISRDCSGQSSNCLTKPGDSKKQLDDPLNTISKKREDLQEVEQQCKLLTAGVDRLSDGTVLSKLLKQKTSSHVAGWVGSLQQMDEAIKQLSPVAVMDLFSKALEEEGRADPEATAGTGEIKMDKQLAERLCAHFTHAVAAEIAEAQKRKAALKAEVDNLESLVRWVFEKLSIDPDQEEGAGTNESDTTAPASPAAMPDSQLATRILVRDDFVANLMTQGVDVVSAGECFSRLGEKQGAPEVTYDQFRLRISTPVVKVLAEAVADARDIRQQFRYSLY
mmetsp:Transcript_136751/g.308963  ORF Transcript_136751/g.308963 Transcript_136751/m.308963 type:complete len:309 (-) Transcript_136751:172-1098(-)